MRIIGRNERVLTEAGASMVASPAALGFDEGSGVSNAESPGERLVPLLSWLAAILTLVLIPLKILSYGYLPPDDALRHAAKAVSGREWSEILVLQDQFKTDHNPGWHWILERVHLATGADPDALVAMSVCGLAILFSLAPLPWMRRPEAWIASLLAGIVLFPSMLTRIFLGRPFAISISATLIILLLWRNRTKFPASLLAVTSLLFGVSAWVHGSWYLFFLVVLAFALAGELKASLRLGACWLAGSLVAGCVTGHPIAFLWNAVNIGITCFSQHQLQRMLVGEFRPSEGDPLALLVVAALLTIRAARGKWTWACVNNPIFILGVLGWIFGLRVIRFWCDWGLPALSLWAALELQEHIESVLGTFSVRRLMISAGVCLALFFAVTVDAGNRWTQTLDIERLDERDPEMSAWLPEPGGILYSTEMRVFYNTFFKNPHGKWKYMLAFEPTFMPPEDLKIFRHIQWNYDAFQAFEPWVRKMNPQDRLVILSSSSNPPAIRELEWKLVARNTWVGRRPRVARSSTLPLSASDSALPSELPL